MDRITERLGEYVVSTVALKRVSQLDIEEPVSKFCSDRCT